MKHRLVATILFVTACSSLPAYVAGQDAAAPAAAGPTSSDDPAVQALLDTNPNTPADLLNIIELLLDLQEPKYAKPLLMKLIATATDEAQLDALGRRSGNQIFFRLGSTPELQPEAKEFADKVSAAMKSAARNGDRIAALIAQLQDPSLDVRAAAIANLRFGGDAATQALLDALMQAKNENERRMFEIALAGMGESAYGPLAAMLSSGNDAAVASAVAALVLIEDRAVMSELYVAAYSPTIPARVRAVAEGRVVRRLGKSLKPIEAAGRLYLTAEGLYKSQSETGAEPTTVWHWDAAAARPTSAMLPRRVDELRRAARYAHTAAELSGNDPAAVRLSRGAALEALLWYAADPATVNDAVAAWAAGEKFTQSDLEGLYEQAAANDRIAAAARWIGLLAGAGSADGLLVAVGGRPTVLVRAASHPDPTIRFTAVEAIVKLHPSQPFAGSSGVADALAWLSGGAGVDRALVVDPKGSRGRDIAALLVESGVRAEALDDSRAALAAAVAQADVQLVFLDQRLLEPSQGNVLGRLRADFHTARLPVVVFTEPEDLNRFRSRLYADPYTLVLLRPTTPEHLTTQLKLNTLPGAETHVAGPERLRRAEFALTAIKEILASKNSVFNLRPYEANLLRAATMPTVAKAALGALGQYGSAAAQRVLVDTASSNALPLDRRQAAAAAFCENVIRFGTLLTTAEIARQYQRYNAAESLDPPTQELLASLLDVMEARVAKIPLAGTPGPTPAASAP